MNHHLHLITNAMNGSFDLICERFHLFNRFSTQCTVRKMRLFCVAKSNVISCMKFYAFYSFPLRKIIFFFFIGFFCTNCLYVALITTFAWKMNMHLQIDIMNCCYCDRYAPKYSKQWSMIHIFQHFVHNLIFTWQ